MGYKITNYQASPDPFQRKVEFLDFQTGKHCFLTSGLFPNSRPHLNPVIIGLTTFTCTFTEVRPVSITTTVDNHVPRIPID
jgi:hypothetical protein